MNDDIFERLTEALKDANDLLIKPMELAAIWLNERINVMTPQGVSLTQRIAEGDIIEMTNGEITGGNNFNTRIMACYGNITSTCLQVMVQSISDLSDIKVLVIK